MTEKRFRFNGMSNCIEYDNESILLDSYGEDIAELLNELHEEKEIAIEGIQIANNLIMKYGSEELKHEWQKNVRVKE